MSVNGSLYCQTLCETFVEVLSIGIRNIYIYATCNGSSFEYGKHLQFINHVGIVLR